MLEVQSTASSWESEKLLLQDNDVRKAPAEVAWPLLSAAGAIQLGRRQAVNDLRTSFPLLVADVLSVIAAIALLPYGDVLPSADWPWKFTLVMIGFAIFLQHMHGLYPACGLSSSLEFRGVLRTSIMLCGGVALTIAAMPNASRTSWIAWIAFSLTLFVTMSVGRAVIRRIFARFDWWVQPVVVFGDDASTESLVRQLHLNRPNGLRAAGIVFDPKMQWRAPSSSQAISADRSKQSHRSDLVSGPANELEGILLATGSCRVMVAHDRLQRPWDYHSFCGIPHVTFPLDTGRHPVEKVRLSQSSNRVQLHCYSALLSPHAMFAKRLVDLALVFATMPLWLPLMIVIAGAIKVSGGGAIFYTQSRVGRHGRCFPALKFRSMVCNAREILNDYLEAHPELRLEWDTTHKLKNDPRVTVVGRFLRRTSLDELPQLLNVISGQMSLVGPRPIIDCSDYDREYIDEHPEVFAFYKMVRPGITGLWQVSGRNATTYKQRIDFDRSYLQNWSITLDLFILWRTVKTALFREGAC